MDLPEIISLFPTSPKTTTAFYQQLLLLVLEKYPILQTLDSIAALQDTCEKFRSALKTEKPKKTGENLHIPEEFYSLLEKHTALLACAHIDEHVLLVSTLAALETKGEKVGYSSVLKEILMKQFHKQKMDSSPDICMGRENEKAEIKRILKKSTKNHVLIVGPTGVGKTTLAKSIISTFSGKGYQLFPGNAQFIDQVIAIQSQTSEKMLFFLDELFSFDQEQISYIADNALCVATANDSSVKKFISDHPALMNKFEIITLEEPPQDVVKAIVEKEKQRFERDYQLYFEDGFVDELLTLAKQYLSESFFPAKGIALLEEASLFALHMDEKKVTAEQIRIIISQKTNIPLGSLTDLDKKDLSTLPQRLKERVKGQDEAIESVSRVIQRAKLGFGKKNRPIGSFLFVGPSGVGKTELAKAVAHAVFGDEEAMVRVDMSEYAEAHTVQRLIGAPPGYIGFEEGGQLTNPVKAKPYTLVLLDEIEKAHPRVFDIFLQVLDDGRLTDGQGKVVDFRNTIIIATSNAGIEDMLDLINEGKSTTDIEKEIKEILQDYFRIEFINRFDGVILFNALKPHALEEIARLQIQKLSHELTKRNITLSISDESLKHIATSSYDPRYGARGLLRFLSDHIENKLAEMILSGELREGQSIAF